jgi:predicted Zn-dependent protease
VPNFLSTHPSPEERSKTVAQLANEWKQKANATNLKVNRDSYLKMIDGLVYGEDPKQGFTEGGVFYHPVLKFQFPVPSGWKLQNTPQQVQMAPQDGRAMMMLTLAQGTSLEAAAQQMLQNYKLQLVDSKQTTVNGLQALALVADQQPQQQQQQQQGQRPQIVRTLTYLIKYGANIYSLMGVTTANDFNSYADVFSRSMQSFRELTDSEKINRQPARIRIKPVAQSTTLAQAIRANQQATDKQMQEIALLNGMELNDRVEKGMLIKVVDYK